MSMEKNLMNIVNKDTINVIQFEELYGEEGREFIKTFIKEHNHILETLRNNEALKFISNEFKNNIDIAKSIYNFYIETKLKDEMIKNLKDEVIEKDEEIKIFKQFKDASNAKLESAINELYNKRISEKTKYKKLRMIKR